MKLVECELESTSPYSQGRYHKTPKLSKELDAAYEERTWQERCHVDFNGFIIIPPMSFCNSLKEAAKYLSLQISSKGKQTWTKHFESGVLVMEPIVLPIKKENVASEWVFVPADGRRGGGRRVEKCFPLILSWKGKVTYYIMDDIITEDVFDQVLQVSGNLIGIGRFRPSNWGYYGRFKVNQTAWGATGE